jgi:hypothetical protein
MSDNKILILSFRQLKGHQNKKKIGGVSIKKKKKR